MIFLILIAALLVILAIALLVGIDYRIKQIVHCQRRLNQGKGINLNLSLFEAPKKLKLSLFDLRDLVISLQLGTSMEATLSGSLTRAAEQFAGRGVLGERLQKHVESRISISPEAVIEGLVEDFDCPQLVDLLERVRMASQGGVSYNQVFVLTANEIQDTLRNMIEQQIRRAPTRLSAIMTAGLFTPVLFLVLAPILGMLARNM